MARSPSPWTASTEQRRARDNQRLRELTDVHAERQKGVPSHEAQKVFALIAGRRRPADIRRAYSVLRAMFTEKA